jgi:hypothetical protein
MWLGVGHDGSAFTTEVEAKRYWVENRDRLMLLFAKDGRRPQAWWHWDAKLRNPGPDRERSVLYVEGLLDDVEARDLLAFWHGEFERANAPNFVFHWRGRLLRGAVARRQHYQWADIPLEEAVAWTKERRRAARRIRRLEAEACAPRPAA